MNKKIIVLITLILILTLTGCNNNKQSTVNTKSKKDEGPAVEYTTSKGTIKLSYKDNGDYEVKESNPHVALINKKNNFRIDLDYSTNGIESQEQAKELIKNNSGYTIIDNIKFGKYQGYAQVDNRYATTILYLYLNKENDVVSYIKIMPVDSSIVKEQISKGTKAENILFKQKEVQKVLKTIKYE